MGLLDALVLGAAVLEPDLDLRLGQVQRLGELEAAGSARREIREMTTMPVIARSPPPPILPLSLITWRCTRSSGTPAPA